jgi:hypothetical protein
MGSTETRRQLMLPNERAPAYFGTTTGAPVTVAAALLGLFGNDDAQYMDGSESAALRCVNDRGCQRLGDLRKSYLWNYHCER